jgi:hypothetical protein
VTGQDKAVVTFTAPESATAQQIEVSLTVSDGTEQHHDLSAERESESGHTVERRRHFRLLRSVEREQQVGR